LKEAWDVLQENMKQWDDPNYFTDEQLETAKNLLAISDSYSKENTSSYIHQVTYWWASADIDYYTNYIDNVQKVTKKDIADYVQKYIKDQPRVTGILLPATMKDMLDVTALGFPKPE